MAETYIQYFKGRPSTFVFTPYLSALLQISSFKIDKIRPRPVPATGDCSSNVD